ncbi:hypothetical protein A6E15_13020 [Natrinema saccharevitans]|uniref:Uncharacterized protein n=1 Tax=Natrinema saccharevitans TaxID=301967 RepID=A0A1S8AZ28_9EURY|nr:hypothetical protein [Natrinema saccharevitans]OLZ41846.1 hypothetical protein A6E15_13020 [Natrinema saccharevitans]
MAATRTSTPRLDVFLALVAVGLLTSPALMVLLDVGERTYRYERVEVTTDGSSVEYADESAAPDRTPVDGAIACAESGPYAWEVRACTFEESVLENGTVPTEFSYGAPGRVDLPFHPERYRYVSLNGTVYETTYVANESAPRDDGYRIDLTLDPSSPEAALEHASHDVTAREVSSTAAEAARTGDATTLRKATVPDRPIRLEDGTYYRVYLAEEIEPSETTRNQILVLTALASLSGLGLLVHLFGRIEVTYVGGRHRR